MNIDNKDIKVNPAARLALNELIVDGLRMIPEVKIER